MEPVAIPTNFDDLPIQIGPIEDMNECYHIREPGYCLIGKGFENFELVTQPRSTQQRSYGNDKRNMTPSPFVVTIKRDSYHQFKYMENLSIVVMLCTGDGEVVNQYIKVEGGNLHGFDIKGEASFRISLHTISPPCGLFLRFQVAYVVQESIFIENIDSIVFHSYSKKRGTTEMKIKEISCKHAKCHKKRRVFMHIEPLGKKQIQVFFGQYEAENVSVHYSSLLKCTTPLINDLEESKKVEIVLKYEGEEVYTGVKFLIKV